MEMEGVREYCEEMAVELVKGYGVERLVVRALNEAGCNATEVDLLDLLEWVAKNMPAEYMEFVNTDMLINYT